MSTIITIPDNVIRGVTFDYQAVTANNDAEIMRRVFGCRDGVISGGEVRAESALIVKVKAGHAIVCGRHVHLTQDLPIGVTAFEKRYFRLKLKIDLSQPASTTEFKQITFECDAADSVSALPALRQTDINTAGGTVYEIEVFTVKLDAAYHVDSLVSVWKKIMIPTSDGSETTSTPTMQYFHTRFASGNPYDIASPPTLSATQGACNWVGFYHGTATTAPTLIGAYHWVRVADDDTVITYNSGETTSMLLAPQRTYRLILSAGGSSLIHFDMSSRNKLSGLRNVITAYIQSEGTTLTFDAGEVYMASSGTAGTPLRYALPIGQYIMRAEFNPNLGLYVLRFENAASAAAL
ncbi:MAG: hypothetical protein RRY79_05055 [Clostridia bacterium]